MNRSLYIKIITCYYVKCVRAQAGSTGLTLPLAFPFFCESGDVYCTGWGRVGGGSGALTVLLSGWI